MVRNLQEVSTNQLTKANAFMFVSSSVITASFEIAIADAKLKANKTLAEFQLAQMDYEILQKMLASIVNKFQSDQEDINLIARLLSSSLESSAEVSKFVAHSIRA